MKTIKRQDIKLFTTKSDDGIRVYNTIDEIREPLERGWIIKQVVPMREYNNNWIRLMVIYEIEEEIKYEKTDRNID